MKLKYFKEEATESGYGEIGIVLNERIFSVLKTQNGIQITEECDGCFFEEFTKEQAIELFEEAIAWVKQEG